MATFPFTAHAEENLKNALLNGKFSGQVRYRYEHIDQDGPLPINKNANASTIRSNIGFETGNLMNFRAFAEGQILEHIGASAFNDTVNSKTAYPIVADPDNAEINQAWLAWTGVPGTEIKAGRQAVNIDNQRFIGSVDWRQNDQTLDSAFIEYKGFQDTTLRYGYLWNINRVFGDDNPLGDLDSQSHILHASHQWTDWLSVSAYGYWLDFDNLAASSSRTSGLRASGEYKLSPDYGFVYETEVAHQNAFKNNPASYGENYFHVTPGFRFHTIVMKAGYEELGGNGTAAFQTPLATLHKFNGWADKFLTTPSAGLVDKYLSASYKLQQNAGLLAGTELVAVYHDFKGDESGDFGSEIDLSVSKNFPLPEKLFFETVNVTLKYADYNAEDMPYTDTQKVWIQTGVNF